MSTTDLCHISLDLLASGTSNVVDARPVIKYLYVTFVVVVLDRKGNQLYIQQQRAPRWALSTVPES